MAAAVRFAVLLVLLAGLLAPAAASAQGPADGPGGPILVVADPGDPFGRYYAEILRAEGLNEFAVAGPGALDPATLAAYQVVLLARGSLSDAQIGALSGWVAAGGNLIAMRPDPRLAGLLGLGADTGDLADAYLRPEAGAGVTGETLQYHGTADVWSLAGAVTVATLYSGPGAATGAPAVTLQSVGGAGGQAAAFAYDLARSVVYTRQGNPGFVDQKRDGTSGPHRSDDLFFPDWVNRDKVRIPQADEQQRLLANLITGMALDRVPLPRFWYLPRGARAAVVMTGDDHASANGTAGQFERFKAASPAGCSVADWQCVRATSYMYQGTPLTDAQAAAFQAEGFELALHLDTSCGNPANLAGVWAEQLPPFRAKWPSLVSPRSNRTHCVAWNGWIDTARAEAGAGVRLDTNYYWWPAAWVQDRPGMFTGSGFPMRFADTDGSLLDVYQAVTQMTDESGIDYGKHIRALLDGALGPEGFYGVFTANMHTDTPTHPGADAIVAEAAARGVPVISAAQLLEWLDGRNGSAFRNVSYAGGRLTFTLDRAPGARGLEAMLPAAGLTALTRDGVPVAPEPRAVKGVAYGVFPAEPGAYAASYGGGPSAVVAAAAPKARDRTRPRVRIRPRRVRVGRKGRIRLRVRCPRTERRCIVYLRVRGLKRGKLFAVAGGKTVKTSLRLPPRARKRLRHGHAVRVVVLVRVRDRAGNRTRGKFRVRVLPRRSGPQRH
jgi:hypothetical protein